MEENQFNNAPRKIRKIKRPRLPEKSEKADNEAVTESIHCPPFWRRYATVYAAHRHL